MIQFDLRYKVLRILFHTVCHKTKTLVFVCKVGKHPTTCLSFLGLNELKFSFFTHMTHFPRPCLQAKLSQYSQYITRIKNWRKYVKGKKELASSGQHYWDACAKVYAFKNAYTFLTEFWAHEVLFLDAILANCAFSNMPLTLAKTISEACAFHLKNYPYFEIRKTHYQYKCAFSYLVKRIIF